MLEQRRNIGRVVFAVAVHNHDRAARAIFAGPSQTDRNGPLMPQIASQPENLDIFDRRQLRHMQVAGVLDRRAVVEKNNLGRKPCSVQCRVNPRQERAEQVPLVEDRNQH